MVGLKVKYFPGDTFHTGYPPIHVLLDALLLFLAQASEKVL